MKKSQSIFASCICISTCVDISKHVMVVVDICDLGSNKHRQDRRDDPLDHFEHSYLHRCSFDQILNERCARTHTHRSFRPFAVARANVCADDLPYKEVQILLYPKFRCRRDRQRQKVWSKIEKIVKL
jgi:hypothetical protein